MGRKAKFLFDCIISFFKNISIIIEILKQINESEKRWTKLWKSLKRTKIEDIKKLKKAAEDFHP